MKYENKVEFNKIKNEIMRKIGVSNDNQLANYLGYTSNSAIAEWNKKMTIPDKILRKYYEKNECLSTKNDLITINLYENINASAGYGNNNDEVNPTKMQFDKNFLKEVFNITSFDNLEIIRVIGDSMLPLINDGEYIIVDRTDDAKSGDTIIANIEGELYVKRLKKIPYEKWFKLESENKTYPAINIDTPEKLNAFNIVGIVKSKIKLY